VISNAPGTKLYLDDVPVTVLADAGNRTYYISGHCDYRVCLTADLSPVPQNPRQETPMKLSDKNAVDEGVA
jgi:hypothetical protein